MRDQFPPGKYVSGPINQRNQYIERAAAEFDGNPIPLQQPPRDVQAKRAKLDDLVTLRYVRSRV